MKPYEEVLERLKNSQKCGDSHIADGMKFHIGEANINDIRDAIQKDAFAAFPGAEEQTRKYNERDMGGWYPELDDPKYGLMVKADTHRAQAWDKAVGSLAHSPEYSDAV